MFYRTALFNSNLAGWQVQHLNDLTYMFYQASSFNQDLCTWRTRLPTTAIATSAFEDTACASTSDPMLLVGPYCAICPNSFLEFSDDVELRNAVLAAEAAGSDCNAIVYQTYGPMNAWKVSRLYFLRETFRDIQGPSFCPPGQLNLNHWNVSQVRQMDGV
jgi:hypothetical protein